MATINFQGVLDRLAAFEANTQSDAGRRVSTVLGQGLSAAQRAAARANIGAAARDEVVLRRGRQTVFGDVTFERPVGVPAGSIPQDRVTGLPADLASKLDAADIAGKADDNAVVKLTGNQTVAGVKTFSAAPVVPDASFAQTKVTNLVADLAGKATVDYTHPSGTTQRTIYTKLNDTLSTKDFGAKGDWDGSTGTDDTVAVQAALDALQPGQCLNIVGRTLISGTLYVSGKQNVTIDCENGEIVQAGSGGYSFLVHGGTLTRTLATYLNEIMEQSYESVTPCSQVHLRNMRIRSNSGRKSTQVMFYFANDCSFNGEIANSNGSGIEFRQCVRPSFGEIRVKDIANYSMFVYQCHGLRGDSLKAVGVGSSFVTKQRHKFYATNDHYIGSINVEDATGVAAGEWFNGGLSFNDAVRAGMSQATIDNRNFAGHEICRNVTVGTFHAAVTPTAGVGVGAPSVKVGAYADNWKIGSVRLQAAGKALSGTNAINIGAVGDIAEGIAGGATFGQNHLIGDVVFDGYANTDSTSLILYGVSHTIGASTYRNVETARIIQQNTPSLLPFGGAVERVEFRNATGDVTMALGALAQRGVWIEPETKKFVSGGCSLVVTPKNSAAESICNPWYIKAPSWTTIGRDKMTIVDGGAGASNLVSTYGFMTLSTSGDVSVEASLTGTTNVYGAMFLASTSTKALTVRPADLTLVGTPSGAKNALTFSGEVNNLGGHTYTGAWSNTLSDSTGGKNLQMMRRVIHSTAAPTTGTWTTGDRVLNQAPVSGLPTEWICTSGGTPGTWLSLPNQAGIVDVDSFAGANDDAKLLAALTYAAAQTRVPAVRLRAGVTTLANSYDMFTGMKVIGAGPQNMAFGEEVATGKAVISKIRFTGASGTSSLFKSAATINYVTFANLAFHGDADCQIFHSTGNVYGAQFHNLDFYGCLSAFGNSTNKFLMTFTHFTGFWTVNAPAGTQFWLGGSDNTLWMGGQANIGGNPSTAGAGLYLVELQGLSKTNVGYAYITARNGWRGLRTSGDCAGLTMYGGVYEGQNDGDPSDGNLIRCEGTGTVRIRDPFLAYGMTSPAGTEHGIVEVACSANGQVLLDGFTYRRDNDVAETVPVAYVSGGTLRVLNGMADKQYNTWTGLPRVQNAGGTLTNDTSVTVLP